MKGDSALTCSNGQRAELLASLVSAIESDGLDWVKQWNICPPLSVATGKRYRGINRAWLSHMTVAKGYDDPRWTTFNEAKKRGWHIPEGCKADTYVEAWDLKTYKKKDKDGIVIVDDDGNPVTVSFMKLVAMHPVWNVSRLENVPAYNPEYVCLEGDYSFADELNKYFQVGPKYLESVAITSAAYSPSRDKIQMPDRKLFTDSEAFLSTLAHESIHSTGHKTRKNRDLLNFFGTEKYAKEELIAELGAVFLMQDFGIEYKHDSLMLNNHAAYIQHWAQALKDKSGLDYLNDAIVAADAAVAYIEEAINESSNKSDAGEV